MVWMFISVFFFGLAEEAFRDFRSGTNYEQNSQLDLFVNSEAEEAFRDFGSETKYGTSSEQSNRTDSSSSSEGSKSEKTHATAAAGDEDEDDCIDMFNVTKGASISPFYMIICDGCGKEMDNTLMCPGCERERPGRLIYNTCKFCDDFPVGHKSDSCPRKDNPVCYELPSLSVDHESNDIALMSDYEPSSP